MEYTKLTHKYWKELQPFFTAMIEGKSFPLKVSFTFIRATRHKFDYNNPSQLAQDQMVRYNWLEDDNADIMIPVFEPYQYNVTMPGVYIKVL